MADDMSDKNEIIPAERPRRSNIRLFMEYMEVSAKYDASSPSQEARDELVKLRTEIRDRSEPYVDREGNRALRMTLNARTIESQAGGPRAGLMLEEQSDDLMTEELGFADAINAARRELTAFRDNINHADALLAQETSRPSSFLLELTLPISVSRDFVANLEEVHDDIWIPRFGIRRARWLWHSQSARQIATHWANAVIDLFTRVRKILY